jgi:hypothetical protein
MKIRIPLKDHDGVHDAIRDCAVLAAGPAATVDDVAAIERAWRQYLRRWQQWGEYFVIEFDTETDTATVIRHQIGR